MVGDTGTANGEEICITKLDEVEVLRVASVS